VRVHDPGQLHRPEIVQAINPLRLDFGLGQSGQQQTRQNGNDGDHHQKFDQREGGAPCD